MQGKTKSVVKVSIIDENVAQMQLNCSLFSPKEQWQVGPKEFIGCNNHRPSSGNLVSDFLDQNDRRLEYHAEACRSGATEIWGKLSFPPKISAQYLFSFLLSLKISMTIWWWVGQVTTNLIKLERQIHAFEGNYLGDTHHYGNISNGYEEYRWLSEDNLEVEQTRKKRKFKESDRLFSKSSLTSREAVEGSQEEREGGSASDVKEESETKLGNKERKKIKPKAWVSAWSLNSSFSTSKILQDWQRNITLKRIVHLICTKVTYWAEFGLCTAPIENSPSIILDWLQRATYRVFFHWYPPKKLKYGKPRLGESTLT